MCWCDPSIKTPCCRKPKCFPEEVKSKIRALKQEIFIPDEILDIATSNKESLSLKCALTCLEI